MARQARLGRQLTGQNGDQMALKSSSGTPALFRAIEILLLRLRGMRRRWAFLPVLSLLCAVSSAGAQAQTGAPAQEVARVFESHTRLCGPAMTNAQNFLDTVVVTFPTGSAAVTTSPDGQLFRVSLSEQGGAINTQFSRYIIGARGHENCATYFTNYTSPTDVAALAGALEQLVRSQFGADALRGGSMPQYYSDSSANSDLLQQDPSAFEYLMQGILPLPDVLTISAVQPGFVSLVSQREISAQ